MKIHYTEFTSLRDCEPRFEAWVATAACGYVYGGMARTREAALRSLQRKCQRLTKFLERDAKALRKLARAK